MNRSYRLPPLHLIRWIADNNVKLHGASKYLGKPSLDAVGVNKRVSVVLKFYLAVQDRFWCATVPALRALSCVLQPLEPDVPRVVREGFSNGMLAVGALRAIHATPRQ